MYKPTVQDILLAYIQTGVKPGRYGYYNEKKDTYCAIGALVRANCTGVKLSLTSMDSNVLVKSIPFEYHVGLTDGFDGNNNVPYYYQNPLYQEGYNVGKEAWEILQGASS